MAAQAITWLPLEEIKRELRIPPGVTDEDGMLVRQVSAAVAFVESEVGLPLLDVIEDRRVYLRDTSSDLFLGFAPFLQDIISISYRGGDPVSTQMVPDVDELVHEYLPGTHPKSWNKSWAILVPENGWPEAEDNRYTVKIKYGMDPVNHPEVTQALVLLVRDYYQGGQQNLTIFSTQAYERILAPLYLRDEGLWTIR